jgi:hypothetical protein
MIVAPLAGVRRLVRAPAGDDAAAQVRSTATVSVDFMTVLLPKLKAMLEAQPEPLSVNKAKLPRRQNLIRMEMAESARKY